MTLEQLIAEAKSPHGLVISWQDKDHRLLRTAKALRRNKILKKVYSEPGVTIFRTTEEWDRLGKLDETS